MCWTPHAFSVMLRDFKGFFRDLADLEAKVGKDAFRFEAAFGPQWQLVWREIVQSLLDESYISPRMAKWLVEAAGITLDGSELVQRRDKKDLLSLGVEALDVGPLGLVGRTWMNNDEYDESV